MYYYDQGWDPGSMEGEYLNGKEEKKRERYEVTKVLKTVILYEIPVLNMSSYTKCCIFRSHVD